MSGLHPSEWKIWTVKVCVKQEITKLCVVRYNLHVQKEHMCSQHHTYEKYLLTQCVLDQFRKISESLLFVKYHKHMEKYVHQHITS